MNHAPALPVSNVASDADFEAFFMEEVSILEPKLPTGEPMLFKGQQVRIHLYGPASEQHVKASDALQRHTTKAVVTAMKQGANAKGTSNEDREADLAYLVSVTKQIDNFPLSGGTPAIYKNPRLSYLTDQVRAHLRDGANFFKAQESS